MTPRDQYHSRVNALVTKIERLRFGHKPKTRSELLNAIEEAQKLLDDVAHSARELFRSLEGDRGPSSLKEGGLVQHSSDGSWRLGTTFGAVVHAVNRDKYGDVVSVDLKVNRIAQPDLTVKNVPLDKIKK